MALRQDSTLKDLVKEISDNEKLQEKERQMIAAIKAAMNKVAPYSEQWYEMRGRYDYHFNELSQLRYVHHRLCQGVY